MINGAHRHEERPLVEGVSQQQHHECLQGIAGVGADEHGELAQHRHRRVSQQALEVGLPDGEHRTHQRRCRPEQNQGFAPSGGVAQRRIEACQQIHARLDHGGRMQERRYWRRRIHRIRQPEMKGQLRRLREAPQQHQQHDGRCKCVFANRIGIQRRKLPAVAGQRQKHQPRKQGQTATAGNEQRLQGRPPRHHFLMQKADQQKGGDAGQLPEKEHHDQIIGQHQAEHGSHERQQIRVKSADVMVVGQVATGVEHDQRTDTAHKQRKQQRQAIQTERQRDVESRDPLPLLQLNAPRSNRPDLKNEADENEQRHQRQQGTRAPPDPSVEQRSRQRRGKDQQHRNQHGRAANSRCSEDMIDEYMR